MPSILRTSFSESVPLAIAGERMYSPSEAKLLSFPYSFAVRELTNVFSNSPLLTKARYSGATSPRPLKRGTNPLRKSSERLNNFDNFTFSFRIFPKALFPCWIDASLIPFQLNIPIKSATAAGANQVLYSPGSSFFLGRFINSSFFRESAIFIL